MSRSILFPILALAGIILFGTTRAGKPAPDTLPQSYQAPGRVVMEEPPSAPMPPPPPAPRLRSEVEAEPSVPEAAPADTLQADSSDVALPADTLAVPVPWAQKPR